MKSLANIMYLFPGLRMSLNGCCTNRGVPDEAGRFYLTDYAERFVEQMMYKLDNPYKNYPLKQSFEKCFTIRPGEIEIIDHLLLKFGREYISGHKRVINDHL